MLKGEAKRAYQRGYMRDYMRKRRGKAEVINGLRQLIKDVKTPTNSVKTLLRPVKTSSIQPPRTDVKDVLVDESGQRYKLIGGVRYAVE